MRQMGEYKFNLTEGSLASCLNQLTSSDGVRYLGLSLAIPQNIGQLNSMAFNVSTDNGERYKPKSCYTLFLDACYINKSIQDQSY